MIAFLPRFVSVCRRVDHVTRGIVKYFSYRKKNLWIFYRYMKEFGLKLRKRKYYCHIFVY